MSRTSLLLAEQGSFFVNDQSVATSFASGYGTPGPGHVSVRGMYVQYRVPLERDHRAHPVIMVPGAAHSGKPARRLPTDGWVGPSISCERAFRSTSSTVRAEAARDSTRHRRIGRSSEGDAALVPNFWQFTNEQAWTIFRFGPTPFIPYEGMQFPVEAQEQYFAQLVPSTEASYPRAGQSTIDALASLLDRVGPAVVLVHSLSGAHGISAAIARPDLVKAVVSIEPRSCAPSDADVQAVFARIPR